MAWNIPNIPELSLIEKNERLKTWIACFHAAEKRVLRLWWVRAIFVAMILGGILAFFVLPPTWAVGLFFGLTGAYIALGNYLSFRMAVPLLRRKIGGLCINCGYDLRATPNQCPECRTVPKDRTI